MNTVKCYGTAYETGMMRGMQLIASHCVNTELYRMYCSEERKQYGKDCEAVYHTYDPQIVEELHGFCDALQESYEDMRTFLFGMYAYTTDVHCSCIAVNGSEGIYLGRNSDFLKKVAPYCLHEEIKIIGQYQYQGNTTGFIELEDGMNEHGLALGLTFVRPHKIKPGFNAGLLVRYLLGHCKSVAEAIETLHELPIGSAQTITMADRFGALAVVECNCEDIVLITSKDAVYAVNAFHSEKMLPYCLPESIDDLSSGLRYQTLQKACACQPHDFTFTRSLLQGAFGFICQYPSFCPADTIWSTIYDPLRRRSFLCDGNPSIHSYNKILELHSL